MPDLLIRRYRPEDRAGVRHVTYQTGYMGEPPTFYWRHRESFSEIWSGYYTDREPGSFWVVDRGGEVVGYLAGCVDTQQAPSAASAMTRSMLRYGLLLRPGTAGFFWRSMLDTLTMGVPEGELHDPRWPAHLHIDLLPVARGQGVGRRLMAAWLAQLRALGSPGCHLGTLAENTGAIAFFETMGFSRHGAPAPTPGMRSPSGGRHHVQLMVLDLSGPD